MSGDNTIWSWIITLFYLGTIVLAFYYMRTIRKEKKNLLLWICITIFTLIMGINKQLDIQILLIITGKIFVEHMGMMEYAGAIFCLVATGLFLLFLSVMVFLIVKVRKLLFRSMIAVSGVVILMVFILFRALSVPIVHIHGMELLGVGAIFFQLVLHILKLRKDNTLGYISEEE